ncbi:MAG: YncE family protein [Chloroflexota bacterium]
MTGPQLPKPDENKSADVDRDVAGAGGERLDDVALGRIVRDVAASWEMPPVRLDQPSWRDRVRTPRARQAAAARGWLSRVGQAATAAVALTVGAALVAVWLTRPPEAAKPGEPTGQATPGEATPAPTEGVSATAMPKLLVEGDLPSPTNLLVQTEMGDYARVDLTSGTIGSPITGSHWPSDLRQRTDGSMACLCFTTSGYANGGYTRAAVSLIRYDQSGAVISRTEVTDFEGAPDPRDGVTAEQPQNAIGAVSYSADGRYAFLGWSARNHPVFKTGIVIVDLEAGAVVGSLALPDRSDGEGDARLFADAPRVVGAVGNGRLAISSRWYSWSPVTSSNPTYRFSSDTYTASFDSGQLADVQLLPGAEGCGEFANLAGPLADGGTWLSCELGGSTLTTVRRIGPDGTILGQSNVSRAADLDGDTSLVSPDGTALYVWNPSTLVLSRVDLASGEVTTAKGPAPTAMADDPLAALGRWLAPSAAAKMLLRSGIVFSPDGTRVYALGVKAASTELSGSAGIYVFDATAMTVADHWPATADFVSLAVSPDGQFVYAAGMPTFDANGNDRQPASITVFNSADGSIRLIAGQLSRGLITFAVAPPG